MNRKYCGVDITNLTHKKSSKKPHEVKLSRAHKGILGNVISVTMALLPVYK